MKVALPVVLLTLWASCCGRAWAGPPFLTDDPEPVELRHWEFYAAAQWAGERHAAAGTSPHVEVNYGALPGLQLHAIVPAVAAASGGDLEYGLGDIELGAKWRFLEEGEGRPQIGIFPLITLPTGSASRGLGAGAVEGLLPIWIQKSFGAFTTYGGVGLRFAHDGDAVVFGWLLQREISEHLALGIEAFVTFPVQAGPVQTQTNLGAVINFSEQHHLLLSAGPSFGTDAVWQAYLAYQLTL